VQRLKDERGVVAVLLALLMVPLTAFAALAIDVAAMHAEKQQLQAGADAAALAIAQDCSRGAATCATASQTAQSFAAGNLNNGVSTATVTTLTTSQVTVRNAGVRQHWFAPVLGVNSTELVTRATVIWGSPTGGTAVLPLAFSWCEWQAQTGGGLPSGTTQRTIYLTKSSGVPNCTGPSNNIVPGGFGWLTTDAGSCNTSSTIDQILHSDPGNSVPTTCSAADLSATVGRTVLLPVFDEYAGTGSGATYTIYGYAAFHVTGYHFGGQNTYGNPCNGNDRCIRGYFAKFVDLSEAFDIGAGGPPLGTSIVSLTQ